MKDMKNIKLGTKLRDNVTGLVGIAVAKTQFLNGCVQYHLKPKVDKEGKVLDAFAVDSQQLEFIDKGLDKKKPKKSTGGIMPDTPKL